MKIPLTLDRKWVTLEYMNKIIKSEKELSKFKSMLEQDAQSCGKFAYFSDNEPESYPCLLIYEEMENSSIDFEVDENQDVNSIEDLQGMEFEVEESFLYDLTFISKNEIKQLLKTE